MSNVLNRVMLSNMEPTPFAKEKQLGSGAFATGKKKGHTKQHNAVFGISSNAAIHQNVQLSSRFSDLKSGDARFSNMEPRNGDESVRELTIDSDNRDSSR